MEDKYGQYQEDWVYLPCGSSAVYDGDFSYICDHCGAVAGSVGRPSYCIEIDKKNEMWDVLSGKTSKST